MALGLVALLTTPGRAAFAITEYPVVQPSSGPVGIALGSDGNVWFADYNNDAIGRITPKGVSKEFPLPAPYIEPRGIAAGPDGNLWFTEPASDAIGRITTGGVIKEFPAPSGTTPSWITAGPDGNLWFTESNGNNIGRITTSGTITPFPVTTAASKPDGIAAGSDGDLWFTELTADKIGRITTSGVVTEYTIPTASSMPELIAPGPDGNLWFTETHADKIGRVTTGGTFKEFKVPTAMSDPIGIAPGPDGNLWFVENHGNNVARIGTGGTITEFAIPTLASGTFDITAGPDSKMWFGEFSADQVGTIGLPHLDVLDVSYIPNRFIKKVAPVGQQGGSVRWLMLNPGVHGIVDATGMHLFGFGATGGPTTTAIGASVSYAFKWAGVFAYDDPFHSTSGGTVKVPIRAARVAGASDQALVTWASGDAPGGFVFDVQIEPPGSSSFSAWRTGVTELSGRFGPTDPAWVGSGGYAFRARLRNASSGAASGWSASRSIALT